MAKLIYLINQSLDGYIADENGKFDWHDPIEEVHTFIGDLIRDVGTYLYGRRMYEVMAVWEKLSLDDQPAYMTEFAEIWAAAEKVVYSKSLQSVSTARTRLEHDFDPDSVSQMKAQFERDITVAGAGLAAQALAAELVDECHLVVAPVVVGGGTPTFSSNIRARLELQDQRRFGNGSVYLRYRVVRQ